MAEPIFVSLTLQAVLFYRLNVDGRYHVINDQGTKTTRSLTISHTVLLV